MKHLVLGGVKSGKSRFAEQCARQWSERPGNRDTDVIYLATAESRDDEFSRRIAQHRRQRPDTWKTVEEPLEITRIIESTSGANKCLLVECLTLWMSNLLQDESRLEQRVDTFCQAIASHEGEIILVSNETGLGIMPANALARRFGDEMGVLHQRLAALCDRVVLTVAGLPYFLKQ